MKIIIAGGTGFLGEKLVSHWLEQGKEVVVLSRQSKSRARTVVWDGKSDGPWMNELDGADAVVNLAGRTVNCRYTQKNLKEMMDSRVLSTQAVGRAIAKATTPPRVWLQMSTATIYAHTYDRANTESEGLIGGNEAAVPDYWKFSIDIAQKWEASQTAAPAPQTRKVALRTSMVMGRAPKSVFGILRKMSRLGLGGSIAGGRQYISWIHEDDFARALDFLMEHDEMNGPVNICSSHPVPQAEFMQALRKLLHVPIGLPATKWMVTLGAVIMRSDTELLLKSRKVVPQRLLDAGFQFQFPQWMSACGDLIQ